MTTIKLGGKDYPLIFGFKALRSLEKHYQMPVSKIFEKQFSSETLESISVMYYACLQKSGGKKLTVDSVEDLLDASLESGENSLEDIQSKLEEAIKNSKILNSTESAG